MVDCVARSKGNKDILPVFFNASPSDVKLKAGLYRNAMAKHRKKFGVEEVKRWEDALVEVAELKGWDLKTRGSSYLFHLAQSSLEIIHEAGRTLSLSCISY
ncbi:toll/interleukin-1 receptor-like protein isoform X2 [Eucalyptus grandis]|uniref:toll/interleukin-1 receptor-like protein isoform X2 n=1 Tax=Eucalyptus grandis TaxID=71139 RepID=UPI00192EE2D2|nr:toll/interleukin-1 receptor-like protein isoform X2 [Eucalyptus grandis]